MKGFDMLVCSAVEGVEHPWLEYAAQFIHSRVLAVIGEKIAGIPGTPRHHAGWG